MTHRQVFFVLVLLVLVAALGRCSASVLPEQDPTTLDIRVYPIQGPGSYCFFAIDKYGKWDASCYPGNMPAPTEREL